jgi:hypothetical protein
MRSLGKYSTKTHINCGISMMIAHPKSQKAFIINNLKNNQAF